MGEIIGGFLDLDSFISQHVIRREQSMFLDDIKAGWNSIQTSISNADILVIGGAGSIGSSFIKAILPFGPSELVIADINENALTELTRDLRSEKGTQVPDSYRTYPVDYASAAFEKMFRAHGGFRIVANFAAHKHVRTEKDIYAMEAMLYNNVIHARTLLELLCEFPPESYFCVSTDKAVNPVSIMGASKRLMEDLIFSYSDRFAVKTARFANVAFSNGSLPAGFLERIRRQQPVSAPSDIRRYFVSPEESGQICMLACTLGNNREIFFPKLEKAQMMTFDGIAKELLTACGYEPLPCQSDEEAVAAALELRRGARAWPVRFSKSDTSGEKPYEEFYTKTEHVERGRFQALGVITDKERPDRKKLDQLILQLQETFEKRNADKDMIVRILQSYLPHFAHRETGKSLDDKM